MNIRSAGQLWGIALVALAACRPTVRGLCNVQDDCRAGSLCSVQGICVGPSSDCSPQCTSVEVCSNHACVPLKPSLKLLLEPGALLSPSLSQVKVQVDAAAEIPLHALVVEAVDSNQNIVATGTVPGSPGALLVTLGSFQPDFAAAVSVSAYLTYDPPTGPSQFVRSPVVQAFLDDQPPSVTVFVPAAADAVDGWVPRTSSNSEVRAQVDDGQGSGPDSATLSLDVCPAALPCTYAGAPLGGGTFSFQVPRMVQAAGVASSIPFTVKGKDKAGNEGKALGGLPIDDSAPQIGAFALVSTGVTGLDGKTWFLGGTGAPAVEIAVKVTDTGVGVGVTSLQLLSYDVVSGTPLDIAAVSPPPPDGKVHFLLPASAVQGRAGRLRFSLTAADKLQHTTTVAASDATAIWVDAQPPAVGTSIVTASDSVSGWVPRTSANIEVDATVDDGTGSGPASATLTFASCPSGVPCSYQGTVAVAPANGVEVFSFLVPRTAQAPGSAAPLPVTVTAKDKVGNATPAQATLQIDDSAPVIGAVSLVTAGTTGEDGKTWFIGGAGGPLVEIAVPASDTGVGVASVALQLDADDVIAGTALNIAPVTPPPADGLTHFQLPASAVRGREGHLRFSVTATDRLQHSMIVGPSDSYALWVDDAPPTVTAPHVDYTSAMPASVCGAGTVCGRGSPPDHLLRDDSATVSFDVTDCGVGVGAAPTASATSAGVTSSVTVAANGKSGTPCAASTNPTHHYSFNLSLPAAAAALSRPMPPAPRSSNWPLPVPTSSNMPHRVLRTAGPAATASRWCRSCAGARCCPAR